ncbi:hypothetical protein LTR48_005232 [Friedmanniomyces endolithicus]|uniref:Uncharacterized protein n=1 Tax=Rachicladosporium monterosium TaxID=1507873 RepID=A0ABR0L2S8_9PEZI|nr:hypothetical protein LTR29_009184 [Friedmanniomyces endolithicus]KAK1091983.1 hypothetical protein LTR48_005232 [Friedmanniomyces endolithicus]KAK1809490.1 hypothetical protein LTR12_016143 [Friedmanniomyces endolithicus]KAK5142622.1 hypothetical protein LTR32_005070 [Rachicladosporium monterosium]
MENEEAKYEEPEKYPSQFDRGGEAWHQRERSALRRNVRRRFGDALIADEQRAAQIALQPKTGPVT